MTPAPADRERDFDTLSRAIQKLDDYEGHLPHRYRIWGGTLEGLRTALLNWRAAAAALGEEGKP
jgi:hypothetical protein